MFSIFFRCLLIIITMLPAGCYTPGISRTNFYGFSNLTNLFPDKLPTPGLISAPCLPASAENRFPAPVELPQVIALLVPLQGNAGCAGQVIRTGFVTAFRGTPIYSRPQQLHVIDTSRTSVICAYRQALRLHANFIVGPLTKADVSVLSATNLLIVPTLSLNYLDSEKCVPNNLYQFGLSSFDEARQVADLARCEGHQSAIILVPCDDWGQHMAEAFCNKWDDLGGDVAAIAYYPQNHEMIARKICDVLQRSRNFDAIFLAAKPPMAREIRAVLQTYGAGNVPIYTTSIAYCGRPQPCVDRVLDGVTFCDMPWILRGCKYSRGNTRLYALGMDAFFLSMRLNDLLIQEKIHGATGWLYLNQQNRVIRELDCARFCGGVPRLLN